MLRGGRSGYNKLADIASASTITTGPDGSYHHVTGTTSITAFASRRAGSVVLLQFKSSVTVVHKLGTLNLLAALDLNALAGTMSGFISEGDGEWTELFRHRVEDGGDVNIEPGGLGGPALVMPAFPTEGTPTVVSSGSGTGADLISRAETMPAFPTHTVVVIDNGPI